MNKEKLHDIVKMQQPNIYQIIAITKSLAVTLATIIKGLTMFMVLL